MTDEAGSATPFGVETIHLDLPAVAGAFTRRLHDAGLPVTPARSADLARALALLRPVSRRRLYWTARAVLVSDPAQVAVFDSVFRSVFGSRPAGDVFQPEQPQTAATASDERAAPGGSTPPREGAAAGRERGGLVGRAGRRHATTTATRWTCRWRSPAQRSAWPASGSTRSSRTSWRSSTS